MLKVWMDDRNGRKAPFRIAALDAYARGNFTFLPRTADNAATECPALWIRPRQSRRYPKQRGPNYVRRIVATACRRIARTTIFATSATPKRS
jgi:hypothetical protein